MSKPMTKQEILADIATVFKKGDKIKYELDFIVLYDSNNTEMRRYAVDEYSEQNV